MSHHPAPDPNPGTTTKTDTKEPVLNGADVNAPALDRLHIDPIKKQSPVLWDAHGVPLSHYFADTYRSIVPSHSSKAVECDPQIGAGALDLGLKQSREVFLRGADLLGEDAAWRQSEHWSILETGFGLGLNFLSTWAQWRDTPPGLKPKRLTYVSIEQYPVLCEDLVRSVAPWPELTALAHHLSHQWRGLMPGFHKLQFEQGLVTLVLCIGEVQSALDSLQMSADTIFLDGFSPRVNPQMWTHKVLGRVSQLARVGTKLSSWCVSSAVLKSLEIHGFKCTKAAGLPPKRQRLEATMQVIKRRDVRLPKPQQNATPPQPGRCAVIGAGLAGACAAYSMAKRGWSVTVFDTAAKPAQGASGVPIGLFATQISGDDNHSSKLTRAGLRQTQLLLEQTMPAARGRFWDVSGVLEIRESRVSQSTGDLGSQRSQGPGGIKKRTSDPSSFNIFKTPEGRDWCELVGTLPTDSINPIPNVWHKHGGWVYPSKLIETLLQQKGVEFCGNTKIVKITKNTKITKGAQHEAVNSGGIKPSRECAPTWRLEGVFTDEPIHEVVNALDPSLHPSRASADQFTHQHWDHVIVANAVGAQELIKPLLDQSLPQSHGPVHQKKRTQVLETTTGQLSFGDLPSLLCKDLPHYPINGDGSFLLRPATDAVDLSLDLGPVNNDTTRWFLGSTFERASPGQASPEQASSQRVGLEPESGAVALSLERENSNDSDLISKRHQENFQKLKSLHPKAHQTIVSHTKSDQPTAIKIGAWSAIRCNTYNHLPWVEHFYFPDSNTQPAHFGGISVLTGLGSKGLVLAPLCAELLASAINHEPSPIESDLRKNLNKINS